MDQTETDLINNPLWNAKFEARYLYDHLIVADTRQRVGLDTSLDEMWARQRLEAVAKAMGFELVKKEAA